jgi:hypothetical protein
LTYGTETTITVGSGRTPIFAADPEWDGEVDTMLDAPEKYEQTTFGVLNDLPKIPARSHRKGAQGAVELSRMGGKGMGRRHSAPG